MRTGHTCISLGRGNRETSWFDLGQVDMRNWVGGRWRGTALKEKTGKEMRNLCRSLTQRKWPQVYKDGPSSSGYTA